MCEKINLESESQLRDESNPPVSIPSVHVSKHFGVDKSLHFKAEYATLSSSKAQRRVSDTIEDLRVILRARFPSPQMTSGWSFMQGWINLQFKYTASLKPLTTQPQPPIHSPKTGSPRDLPLGKVLYPPQLYPPLGEKMLHTDSSDLKYQLFA